MAEIKNPEIAKLVADAEDTVKKEDYDKQKAELTEVLREIKKAEQVLKRLNAKKDRLIADLDA